VTDSIHSLTALRRRIARLEGGRSHAVHGGFTTGHEGLDSGLGGGFARGRIHELFGREAQDAGSASAFAMLLALRASAEGRSMLWLRTDKAVRQCGTLYGPGLAELGVDPAALLLGIMPDDKAVLRAAADALRCTALGAVVIECWGNPAILDLTASRRLALAAENAGTTAIFLRLDAVSSPSAAETRWQVAAAPSSPLAANAPGHSVFDIVLLRRRAGLDGLAWRMEWNRDRRCFVEPGEQTLSGAVVPVPASGPAAYRGTRAMGAVA
jgi:protein ImuA